LLITQHCSRLVSLIGFLRPVGCATHSKVSPELLAKTPPRRLRPGRRICPEINALGLAIDSRHQVSFARPRQSFGQEQRL
jgi:hypothetical protein